VLLQNAPDVSVRGEVGLESDLMQGLVEGRLDIAVMYTPESRPGLKVELLFDERLVFVSTEPGRKPEPGPGYVYIDWGPSSSPGTARVSRILRIGADGQYRWLGLQHVLENGGSGYFPIRLVRPHLQSGRLTMPSGGPEFGLSAYVVYPTDAQPDVLGPALDVIRMQPQWKADRRQW